jgi:hypothetical protein
MKRVFDSSIIATTEALVVPLPLALNLPSRTLSRECRERQTYPPIIVPLKSLPPCCAVKGSCSFVHPSTDWLTSANCHAKCSGRFQKLPRSASVVPFFQRPHSTELSGGAHMNASLPGIATVALCWIVHLLNTSVEAFTWRAALRRTILQTGDHSLLY